MPKNGQTGPGGNANLPHAPHDSAGKALPEAIRHGSPDHIALYFHNILKSHLDIIKL
jgi:hypothetical protein